MTQQPTGGSYHFGYLSPKQIIIYVWLIHTINSTLRASSKNSMHVVSSCHHQTGSTVFQILPGSLSKIPQIYTKISWHSQRKTQHDWKNTRIKKIWTRRMQWHIHVPHIIYDTLVAHIHKNYSYSKCNWVFLCQSNRVLSHEFSNNHSIYHVNICDYDSKDIFMSP